MKNLTPKRLTAIVAAVFLSMAIGIAGHTYNNFHVVTPGAIYRSAQPGSQDVDRYAREYGIRSILNLRGEHRGSSWYKTEMAAVRANGIAHYDVDLSASREVSPEELDQIITVLRQAPKPVLIHCQAGADRTGLVAAVWKLINDHATPEEASGQLSVLYGHFPYFLWGNTCAMDKSYWRYVDARKAVASFP